jgi:hypothetical protein
MGEFNRRTFLANSAGVAAGAAMGTGATTVVAAGAAAAGAVVTAEVVVHEGPALQEVVAAYVRDAERGVVTVTAGTSETTYRDPVLAKRLLAAADGTLAGGAR